MIGSVKVDENPVTLYVKKFRSLCDMHSVRFGLANSFSAFMKQLAEDRKFAMDFWALVARFSDREGGELSDEQMLNVIVQEIAGCSVSAADGSLKQEVDDLARMLAGEDVSTPIVRDEVEDVVAPPAAASPLPMKPIPTPASRSFEAPPSSLPSQPAIESRDEPSPLPDSDERVQNRMASEVGDRGSLAEPSLTQHQLDEALLRLELNSLELKLHLDNIDSRMSRMEPHLEELASRVSAARESVGRRESVGQSAGQSVVRIARPEPVREPVREHARPIQESVGRAMEKSRLVLEPQPVPVMSSAEDDDDPSIPIPLAGYSQRRMSQRAGLFAALLLVGVGGFFFLHRQYGASLWADFGPSLRERYDAARHEFRNVVKGRAADGSGSVESVSSATNDGDRAQAAPVASAEVASPPVTSEAADQSTADQSTNQPTKTVTESQAASSITNAHPKQKSHAETITDDREVVETSEGVSGGGLEGPVSVASSVMEENLVMSRVPAYPEVAKADHVEGPVVMQAIITKNGTVGHLHVIQGDPMLRSAASEAVSKWRYRPYTVNGKPVEVATTVTVDFKLNH